MFAAYFSSGDSTFCCEMCGNAFTLLAAKVFVTSDQFSDRSSEASPQYCEVLCNKR